MKNLENIKRLTSFETMTIIKNPKNIKGGNTSVNIEETEAEGGVRLGLKACPPDPPQNPEVGLLQQTGTFPTGN